MEKKLFNDNWQFRKEDGKFTPVVLPHDAMLYEDRRADSPLGAGGAYFTGGNYEYKKLFTADEKTAQSAAIVEFGGIYHDCVVFLNGEKVGENYYGYTRFFIDLTGKLKAGENEIVVTVDNSRQPNSRWYTGSGIYRNVYLHTGEKARFVLDGIRITTLSIEPAVIRVEAGVTCFDGDIKAEVKLNGKEVASGNSDGCEIRIPDAKLWSAEQPDLYELTLTLSIDGKISDKQTIPFGIRQIECNAEDGLKINGKTVKLKGGCIHHDYGILGACFYEKAARNQIKKLKSFGYNAVRYSHYPAPDEFLKICDELGMYVLDESFDIWKTPKNEYDYSTHFDTDWRKDVDALIKKDYNHPCVIMYSIGNEISDLAYDFGMEISGNLCRYIKSQDGTRPVTNAINVVISFLGPTIKAMLAEKMKALKESGKSKEEFFTSQDFNDFASLQEKLKKMLEEIDVNELLTKYGRIFDDVDIVGFNYGDILYEKFHKARPDYVLLSSETYPKRIAKNWNNVMSKPYVIGDFMWTAWDYLGEAGVGIPEYGKTSFEFAKPYPALLANCGSFDILGNPDTQAYAAAIAFGAYDKPYIAVRPLNRTGEPYATGEWRLTDATDCWTWQGFEGKTAEIEVYGKGTEIELFLNGKSLGVKRTENNVALFTADYESGELTAVIDGDKNRSCSIRTAEGKGKLTLKSDDDAISFGEITWVNIQLEDGNGTIVPSGGDVELTVEGGELLAFGSANHTTEESFITNTHSLYGGRAQAVVRGCGLEIKIRAVCEGQVAYLTIKSF